MALLRAALVLGGGLGLGLVAYVPLRRDLRSLGRQLGIDGWAAWGCSVVAVAGIASITALSGSFPENDVLVVWLWIVYFLGWFGLTYALSNYGLYRQLDATPRTGTGSVGATDRCVAVSGTATPIDTPATTPLLGHEAVCYTWSVDEYRRFPHPGWYTAAMGQGDVPFTVDDGSGPILVVPDEAEFRLTSRIRSRQVDADESPPADAVEFLADEDAEFDPAGTTHQYEEQYVPEGETVYVFGAVRSPDPGDYPGRTALVDHGEPFVVGTGDVETVTGRLGRTVRAAALVGVVAVLIGYLGQLFAAGVTPS